MKLLPRLREHVVKSFVSALAFALIFSFASFANAQDEEGIAIDIVGGVRRTYVPIAIPPFRGGGTIGQEMHEVILRDLQLSGYFKILPQDSFFFDWKNDGLTPSTINFQNWFNVGASGLIKGSYKEASGQVSLDFRLFMVNKGAQAKLKWEPKAIGRDEVRKEAHEFANAIVEFYTGARGIFGTRIAFSSRTKSGQKHIYVTDMDGSNLRRITKNDSINLLPSWGNGGVYYTSYKDGNPNLYHYKGGTSKLVSSVPGQNSGASYCKGKVAVTLSQGGKNTDIYLIHPNTGKVEARLTTHWGIDTSPTWSPNCKQIAFVSDRSGGPQIYVMNADGSDQRRLTFQGKYNTTPDWSPKGKEIAFTARDERGAFDIFTVDLEGHIERLTQNQGSNEEPSYSPNGRYIVFTSTRGGGGSKVYIMTADGGHQSLISRGGGGYSSPAWAK